MYEPQSLLENCGLDPKKIDYCIKIIDNMAKSKLIKIESVKIDM